MNKEITFTYTSDAKIITLKSEKDHKEYMTYTTTMKYLYDFRKICSSILDKV